MCILCSQGCWTALPENRGFEAFAKGKPGQDNRLYWKMKKRVRSLESVPKKVIYRLERLEITGRCPIFLANPKKAISYHLNWPSGNSRQYFH